MAPLLFLTLCFLGACSQRQQNQTPSSTAPTSSDSGQEAADNRPSAPPADSAQTQPADVLGGWGGLHLSMSVTSQGASVEFDCAHGQIAEPLRLDAQNGFAARGTYVQEHPGPVLSGAAPNSQAALYTGTITGMQMTIAVKLLDTNQEIGTFVVGRGQPPRLFKCR
jgi:hypothetical protein